MRNIRARPLPIRGDHAKRGGTERERGRDFIDGPVTAPGDDARALDGAERKLARVPAPLGDEDLGLDAMDVRTSWARSAAARAERPRKPATGLTMTATRT
jgi:hypothetical protein